MSNPVPRVIYSLWLDGSETAPEMVRLNLARWRRLNPSYEIRVFDRGDAAALLEGAKVSVDDLTPQALSDLVRARVLAGKGGIWTDASVFPMQPLDEWLCPIMDNRGGFFAFERPGPDRIISSWFLASTSNNPILREWWKEADRFWSAPKRLTDATPIDPVASVSPQSASDDTYAYFWFHYLFQYVVETNTEVADLWSACARLPAGPPHRLQTLFLENPLASPAEIRQAAAAAPVQKLNWRASYPLDTLSLL